MPGYAAKRPGPRPTALSGSILLSWEPAAIPGPPRGRALASGVPIHSPHRIALDPGPDARHVALMLIYKIFRAPEWADLSAQGESAGAPVDIADGYVHFSTAGQLPETAAKHFAGEDGLVLLALDADSLGAALRWEPSRGGALFPHLYRKLRLSDILWHRPLPLIGGHHRFPEEIV